MADEISEVKIYDQQGILKIYKKFNKVKKATLNINNLLPDTYFIEIINGNYKERHQLLKINNQAAHRSFAAASSLKNRLLSIFYCGINLKVEKQLTNQS